MEKHYMFIMALVAICTVLSSCNKDEIATDNEGIEMRMRNEDNGGDMIRLLKIDSAFYCPNFWYSRAVKTIITSSNNFDVNTIDGDGDWSIVDDFGVTPECSIASVGKISSLSGIKNIPENGWSESTAVQQGYGYVIKHYNRYKQYDYGYSKGFCRYARIYVEEWILGVDGGILGATIRYQDNWIIEK